MSLEYTAAVDRPQCKSDHAAGATSASPTWTLAAGGSVWALLITQLWVEWSTNEQYGYGQVVPLLALYLGWSRWRDRPTPAAPAGATIVYSVVAIALVALLPLRLICETSPEWRLIYWATGGLALGTSLTLIYGAGGVPWLRHFWFPVAFLLVAIPWPHRLETAVLQALMHTVAGVCTEALSWLGFPAVQFGNVIEVSGTTVGVEEACSGVRSLQTTIMSSLFLGELYRLCLSRRAALFLVGILFAFACNLARSFVLVWLAATRGDAAIAQWHDGIGLGVMGVTVGGLLLLAHLLRRDEARIRHLASPSARPHLIPRWFLVTVIALVVVAEGGTRFWFAAHASSGTVTYEQLNLRLPTERPHFQRVEMPKTTFDLLRYDLGKFATWQEPDGARVTAILLAWERSNPTRYLAERHTPEICLPAAGSKLEAILGPQAITISGRAIGFQRYRFRTRAGTAHVFYSRLAEGEPMESTRFLTEAASEGGLREALAGRRPLGQQVLEVAITGLADYPAAERVLQRALEGVVEIRQLTAK
jgi:exosortase